MCYHTHSSPNESIDFAVLWCTQSIDSFGKNGDIFSICTIYIFQTFFGTFPMTFLQKFSNQKVQFSIKINNIPKKPFEKSVRNISIHLKLLCQPHKKVGQNKAQAMQRFPVNHFTLYISRGKLVNKILLRQTMAKLKYLGSIQGKKLLAGVPYLKFSTHSQYQPYEPLHPIKCHIFSQNLFSNDLNLFCHWLIFQ